MSACHEMCHSHMNTHMSSTVLLQAMQSKSCLYIVTAESVSLYSSELMVLIQHFIDMNQLVDQTTQG